MADALAMVMLVEDFQVRAAHILRDLAVAWPNLPPVTEMEEKDASISFKLGEALVVMGKMPAPIPSPDIQTACARSVRWRNAAEQVKLHKMHWIVAVMGVQEALDVAKLLTQVSASFMASCPPALGIYWCNAVLVYPKQPFIDIAKQSLPLTPPVNLWVAILVGKDSENTSCGFTTGLAALGFKDFETRNAPESPADLHQRLMGLAEYVIWHDPTIRDGDTIGQDENEKIRVVYSSSTFGQEGQVMRLDFPQPSQKKAWWKPRRN